MYFLPHKHYAKMAPYKYEPNLSPFFLFIYLGVLFNYMYKSLYNKGCLSFKEHRLLVPSFFNPIQKVHISNLSHLFMLFCITEFKSSQLWSMMFFQPLHVPHVILSPFMTQRHLIQMTSSTQHHHSSYHRTPSTKMRILEPDF